MRYPMLVTEGEGDFASGGGGRCSGAGQRVEEGHMFDWVEDVLETVK